MIENNNKKTTSAIEVDFVWCCTIKGWALGTRPRGFVNARAPNTCRHPPGREQRARDPPLGDKRAPHCSTVIIMFLFIYFYLKLGRAIDKHKEGYNSAILHSLIEIRIETIQPPCHITIGFKFIKRFKLLAQSLFEFQIKIQY